MKQCKGCGETKSLDKYYKHPATGDGFASKCKECAKAVVKAARNKNPEKYREYEKQRAMSVERVAARSAYRSTDKGKAAVKRAHAVYHAKAPARRKAQVAVGNAVRDGRLIPWPACAVPDCCNAEIEAHHPDYSRPLDVVWLCNSHHREAHAITPQER